MILVIDEDGEVFKYDLDKPNKNMIEAADNGIWRVLRFHDGRFEDYYKKEWNPIQEGHPLENEDGE